MSTLLRIDASSRHDGSWSRRFGDEVAARLAPSRTITRDLAKNPVGHVPVEAIAAFFSDPAGWSDEHRNAQALSSELIDEILAADEILITLPMYNFGIPSALKAWIDQIVRIGKTFAFDGQSFAGLVTGKRATVVIAYGADGYPEGDFKAADFAGPYMRFILGFIGITDVTIVPVEGMNVGKADLAEARARAVIATTIPTFQRAA
jgi:FMN-dependent NADH-azoreductase